MPNPLTRRDFVKTTVASVAGAIAADRGGSGGGSAVAETLALENDQMVWELSRSGRKIASAGLRNKLSGRHFPLLTTSEIRLVASAANERIEIPWWRCTFSPDDDSASQVTEQGHPPGFHKKDFDDSKWSTCFNLGLRGLSSPAGLPLTQGRPPVVFRGYGWFRAKFELPSGARGEEIVLNLGGYDETDWNEYWVYVNGAEVGRRSTPGRWRSPGQFRISPRSSAYQSVEFGLGEANLVAVRTHAYDRHYGDMSDDILDRHIFDAVLHDQFVTVGEPYLEIADFEIVDLRQELKTDRPSMTVNLVSPSSMMKVELHYELEGPIRRKWAEVKNDSRAPVLLLDIDLDTFQIDAPLADGGYGYPLTIEDQVYAAVEHPSGLNRWHENTVHITHFPGRWLKPGETWRSHSAIVGVGPARGANRAFLDYMEAHTVRKNKILAFYDPFGLTAFTEGTSWALNDDQNIGTLNLLAEWQKRGIKFDYYIPDMSLDTTSTSDLKRFRLFSFPDGPGKMVQRIRELGMKFGQWFSVTGGAWSNGRNPKTAPSRIPSPKESPYTIFRNGFLADIWGGVSSLCVASEPYFSMLRDAIVHHIRKNHVELIKLDVGDYYCNSTQHMHLPGKYSTEESFNRLIEISSEARNTNPDVFVVWYWGAYSPFFALHGDVIFDIRLSMEAASTGDFPALFFRDAVTQALDQGSQYARWLPPKNHDSLGVWLANNWWGNQMETVRWQEALIMDLARGNLLFPQIWADIFNFEERDVEFLARIQGLVRKHESVFLGRRYTVGDAWHDQVYGYCYFEGPHGFVFLNNVSFDSRKAKLLLGEPIGLNVDNGKPFEMHLHHPSQAVLTRNGSARFAFGEEVEIQLRPFEVAMIELTEEGSLGGTFPGRELSETSPRYSYSIPIKEISGGLNMEMHFADADLLERKGFGKRYKAFEAALPMYPDGRHYVAVVNTFSRRGRRWRQSRMSELVQSIGEVDGTVMEFTATPDFRQISNNQWNPWIVFSAPLPASFTGRSLRFGVSAYLPSDVEVNTALWVVKEWWPPRMRPLPNYWV
jgi:hypothetical protein